MEGFDLAAIVLDPKFIEGDDADIPAAPGDAPTTVLVGGNDVAREFRLHLRTGNLNFVTSWQERFVFVIVPERILIRAHGAKTLPGFRPGRGSPPDPVGSSGSILVVSFRAIACSFSHLSVPPSRLFALLARSKSCDLLLREIVRYIDPSCSVRTTPFQSISRPKPSLTATVPQCCCLAINDRGKPRKSIRAGNHCAAVEL